jgi:hypothetical protein
MMFKRLNAFFNPEQFQGWGKTSSYFEGWYFKLLNADASSAFAIIPGIAMDKKGKDGNNNGEADAREGKDIAHRKALSKGGSNKDGYFIQSAAGNRSFKRNASGALVSEVSKRERTR